MSSGLCGNGRQEEDVGKADIHHGQLPPPPSWVSHSGTLSMHAVYVCVHVCAGIYVRIYMQTCVYMCVCGYARVCIYIYICIAYAYCYQLAPYRFSAYCVCRKIIYYSPLTGLCIFTMSLTVFAVLLAAVTGKFPHEGDNKVSSILL